MRVLVLTRYAQRGASSRLRMLQYLPALEARGIACDVHELLDEAYLESLYAGRRISRVPILRSYLRRLRLLLASGSYDVVWLEKEALPWLPAVCERFSAPVVVDYDDAVFHRYDQHRSMLVRGLLGRKIAALVRRAAVVVVGNRYLASYAKQAGARTVVHVPTCVDEARYLPAGERASPAGPMTVGWIGTPHTARFLQVVRDVLATLVAEGQLRVRLIGAGDAAPLACDYASVPWDESTEVAELQGLDCGIMPLVDEPFERGKSGYKLIQYMACGLPVVASPVGANREIVEDGVTGFLATSPAQWETALRRLSADPALREQLGAAGRGRFEAHYTMREATDGIESALRAAASA